MEEENWFTVGKPRKVKSGENKTVNGANGENNHQIVTAFNMF